MSDANNHDNTISVIEDKARQIIKILESEDIDFVTAKMIIRRVEEELRESGNTFLRQAKFKNVSPLMFANRH